MNSVCVAVEAVIDTNVLLDWLVFDDPAVATLSAALRAGRLRWVATPAMLDELRDVERRPALTDRPRPNGPVEQAIKRWCRVVDLPTTSTVPLLVCADPDDQKFIDLALARGSMWLLSRDKALLALARRASAYGVRICQPAAWSGAVRNEH